MDKKLTIQQEKFCLKYSECGNASEAYRYAYKCAKSSEKTINECASRLMNDRKIATRIAELKKITAEKSEVTKERLLAEYSKIAFSSIAHYHNTWIDRVDFERLTDDQKASIESIDSRVQRRELDGSIVMIEQVKVKLYNKLSALDSMAKMLGYNEPQKIELSTKSPREMTEAELQAEIDAYENKN